MKPSVDDAGSLSRMHDIIQLAPTPFWPSTPIWYVLGLLLMIFAGLGLAWIGLTWRSNWYRRVAERELQELAQTQPIGPDTLGELTRLLKRVALVAYPREQVASLTGAEWLQFLDQTSETVEFSSGPGRQLISLYERDPKPPTPELCHLASHWIRHHRKNGRC